jgi:putative FmdB family regulatory protein
MPLYDYQCRACKTVTEVRHGSRETHEGVCPACGGELARVFNAAGIVFKGSGFYVNDSRKSSDAGAAGSTSPSSASGTTPAPAAATPAPAADSGGPKKSETAA